MADKSIISEEFIISELEEERRMCHDILSYHKAQLREKTYMLMIRKLIKTISEYCKRTLHKKMKLLFWN